MAQLSELPLKYRLFLKAYHWRRINPVPWTPLKKPLSECRLVLVSSAGIVTSDQKPFDNTIRGGDPSIREIPVDVEVSDLRETHRSEAFDHRGIRRDPNLYLFEEEDRLEREHSGELLVAWAPGRQNLFFFGLKGGSRETDETSGPVFDNWTFYIKYSRAFSW